MKREAELKANLVEMLRDHIRFAVVLRHEDIRTAGIPDISITFHGVTTWWECKHATPKFASSGIQELTMMRLCANGYARYIIWYEKKGIPPHTLIVHPTMLAAYETKHEHSFDGLKSMQLIDHIRKVHKNGKRRL